MSTETTAAIGTVIDEVDFPVEEGKVREFAIAAGATDLGPVPLTFAAVAGHWRDQAAMVERLNLDIRRVVVGGSEWEYRTPVRVGDRLRGARVLTAVELKRGMRLLMVETTLLGRDGEVAVIQRDTVIELGESARADSRARFAGNRRETSANAEAPNGDHLGGKLAGARMTASYEMLTPPVTRTQIVRFAGAAGDFNPMHHDELFAQAAGQPSVFAMGQLTAAIVGAAVAEWFGAERVTGYGVRFKDKVWPGDRLALRAVPDPGATSSFTLGAARESDGTDVLSGWATVAAETSK